MKIEKNIIQIYTLITVCTSMLKHLLEENKYITEMYIHKFFPVTEKKKKFTVVSVSEILGNHWFHRNIKGEIPEKIIYKPKLLLKYQ